MFFIHLIRVQVDLAVQYRWVSSYEHLDQERNIIFSLEKCIVRGMLLHATIRNSTCISYVWWLEMLYKLHILGIAKYVLSITFISWDDICDLGRAAKLKVWILESRNWTSLFFSFRMRYDVAMPGKLRSSRWLWASRFIRGSSGTMCAAIGYQFPSRFEKVQLRIHLSHILSRLTFLQD